jgi:sugar (pentulose or hexulose) kinase
MSEPVIAIFDVGKTNKKLVLFDRHYQVMEASTTSFPAIKDDDGYPTEDLKQVCTWVKQSYRELKKRRDIDIKAVNASAYGATLVHLDDKGRPATHLYNYLKPYPEDVAKRFYDTYGGKEAFSLKTASPALGMLNTGLQLYWLKYCKPKLYEKIKRSLHLPQYITYLLHGKTYSEITSLGCHTGLWDFDHDRSHDWIYTEKMGSLLPPVVSSFNVEDIKTKLRTVRCGVGIHDSSAALAPYLLSMQEPFMLLSTGTWNITFNPSNQEPLSTEELRRDCLSYMDYRGTPVRASRIFLGHEHAYQVGRIAEHFGKSPDYYTCVQPNMQIMLHLLHTNHISKRRFYPQQMGYSGPMPEYGGPENDLSHFSSFEETYHQLMLDLVTMQLASLKLARGNTRPEKIIVTGGFCMNPVFLQTLATFYQEAEIYTSKLNYASALGAALVIHRHWNRTFDINYPLEDFERIKPLNLPEIKQYPLVS